MLGVSLQSVVPQYPSNAGASNNAQAAVETRLSAESPNGFSTSLGQTQAANPLSSHESNKSQSDATKSDNSVTANPSSAQKSDQEAQELKEIEQVVNQLKARDREVRTHEQAHVAAGGQHVTGGPTYQYQTGPDGNKYAVGGEVGIDTSPVSGDPQATLQKAMQIQAAALAPAEPSAQDRSVASAAAQMAAQARADIAAESQKKLTGEEESDEDSEQPNNVAGNSDEQTSSSQEPLIKTNESPLLSALNQERNQFETRLLAQSA